MSSKSASRSRSKNKDDRRVYVTGFSTSNTREEDIRTAFSKFGEIQDLSWKGRFCFIAYAKAEDATEAITQMHQQEMSGHKLLVEQAKSRKNDGACYSCGRSGHFARNCRDRRSSRHHRHRRRSSSSSSSSSRDKKKKKRKRSSRSSSSD